MRRSNVRVPSSYSGLPNSPAWRFAGPYLARKLQAVFQGFSGPNFASDVAPPTYQATFEAINQATYPGFIRQERAKRQGHEAEARLANLLAACGIAFEPKEKADNPLCRDATLHGVSFDIVIPSVAKPLVCFKATVHTANIGQYGESKDHLEVAEAVEVLHREFGQQRPLLMALIDGIGFQSNSAGLNGVLEKADEFCQFRTLWKAVVVAMSKTGRTAWAVELPEGDYHRFAEFFARHGVREHAQIAPAPGTWSRRISAGDANILLR